MALLSTTMLLQYERAGHCCTRKILSPGDVRAVVPSIDAAFAAQELDSCRQKIRVIAGEEALEKADAAAGADPAERLRSLRRAVQALPSGSVPFLQCFNLWRSAPAVFELLCSAEIAGTAAQLLGADRVRLYQDSLFLKRPGDGETHWHSDLAMAPLDTNDFVTVWLPLQPVPAPEQGGSGLLFASRSHRDVALPMWHGEPHTPLDASDRGYAIESAGRLAVGDASWHHGWMLHSAAANEMKAPRRALAASFFADGARRLRKPRRAVHDEDAESSAAWLSDDFAAFVTSQFLPKSVDDIETRRRLCPSFVCAIVQWARQVQGLATALQSQSGESASVHIFSPCIEPALAAGLGSKGGARVFHHEQHAKALVRAVAGMRAHAEQSGCCREWLATNLLMLYRWEIFSLADARVVIYLDLDVEVLPRWSLLLRPGRAAGGGEAAPAELSSGRRRSRTARSLDPAVTRVAADWLRLLRCANASNASLLSFPDHSSPVHGALLIVRPDAALYREGVRVLQEAPRHAAANASFSGSAGWEGVGPPSDVVPPTDHVWWRRAGNTHLVDRDDWGFVGGRVDQGFVYHMLRVRHRRGADIRLAACSDRQAATAAGWQSYFYHYGASGGQKPDILVRHWSSLRAHNRCYGAVVPHFAENGEVLVRTLGWARRTRAEVSALMEEMAAEDEALLLGRSQLHPCSATLDRALSCVMAAARVARVSNLSLPRLAHAGGAGRSVPVHTPDLMGFDAVGRLVSRPVPLLTPAQTSGRWAAYQEVSRHPTCTRMGAAAASDSRCRVGLGADSPRPLHLQVQRGD